MIRFQVSDIHISQNFKYLYHKEVKDMLETAQLLHILAAEAEHLVTVSIFLPTDVKSMFERRLNDAFASDSYSDTAKAWNEERSLVVQEALEQHLIPTAVKWTKEWVREEAQDHLATRCGGILRNVSGKKLASPYF
jgi:transcription elongation factor SPT6